MESFELRREQVESVIDYACSKRIPRAKAIRKA